jgi:hypothetical protein
MSVIEVLKRIKKSIILIRDLEAFKRMAKMNT